MPLNYQPDINIQYTRDLVYKQWLLLRDSDGACCAPRELLDGRWGGNTCLDGERCFLCSTGCASGLGMFRGKPFSQSRSMTQGDSDPSWYRNTSALFHKITEGKHVVWMILELKILSNFKPMITLDPLKKGVLFPHQASASDSGCAGMLEMVNSKHGLLSMPLPPEWEQHL